MVHSLAPVLIAIASVFYLPGTVISDVTFFNFRSFSCLLATNATNSYLNNVDLMLSDFILNSAFQGYYNTSIGERPDTVFGYYMCRGDLKPEECRSCIVNGTEFAHEADCKHQDGMFLSEKCMFRYANHSMYGVLDREYISVSSSTGANVSNYQQYDQTLSVLLEDLISEAASENTNNNNRSSVLGFATKEADIMGGGKIYSLAQCTPDIVGVNCSICLNYALFNLRRSYDGYQGAYIITGNCQLKYDNQTFYYLADGKPNHGDSLRPSNLVLTCFSLFVFSYYTYANLG